MSQDIQDKDSRILEHCRANTSILLPRSPVYGHFFGRIEIVSASKGYVVAHLPLENIHVNSKKSLHGSVSCTLVDFIGGLAIVSYDLRESSGVSTDLHTSFMGLAMEGETLEITGRVLKVGGTLAYTTAEIRKVEIGKREGQGALVATGSHTKFVKR